MTDKDHIYIFQLEQENKRLKAESSRLRAELHRLKYLPPNTPIVTADSIRENLGLPKPLF